MDRSAVDCRVMGSETDGSTGRFIASKPGMGALDSRRRELFEAGWAAAPPGFLEENVVAMMPRRATSGRCRLCGAIAALTREHIPPRSSGNKATVRSFDYGDWQNREEVDDLPGGREEQGGVFGYTLCGPCNSYTGAHYGDAYKRCSEAADSIVAGLPPPAQLDRLTEPLGWPFEAGNLANPFRPGAVVRQVLSCFCSLSGSWDLAARHPEVRRVVLEQSCEELALPLAVGMSFFLGPRSRYAGPSLVVLDESSSWQWVMEFSYPPLSFLMVLDANTDTYDVGTVISDWTLIHPSEVKHVQAPTRIGFGWTPYPGDYRSRAQIVAER